MSCPCGLSQDRVVDLDQRDRVPLIGGKCQNPLADGSDGICGKALGAHPLAQGNFIFLSSLVFPYLIFYDRGWSNPDKSQWTRVILILVS